MSIESICQKNVITIRDTATLREVSRLMRIKHIGCVVVTRPYEGRRVPVGIVTDRDLAISLGTTIRPQDMPVQQIMKSNLVTVNLNDNIQEAIQKMLLNGVKRLPVVDFDGSLRGIVSADDLLRLLSDEINSIAQISETEILNEKGDPIPLESMAYL